MRVIHVLNLNIFDDTTKKDVLFGPDELLAQTVIDNMQRYVTGRFSIDPSANENLSFGDVNDVRGIWIKAAGDFNVKFNGGAEVQTVKRAGATGFAKIAGEFQTTAINVANPSATAVLTGIWGVYGDPSS